MARGNYQPDRAGIRELGQLPALGEACLEQARKGAAWANSDDPTGGYVAEPATVQGGRGNEPRRGAVVEETRYGDGAERRTLVRAVPIVERG